MSSTTIWVDADSCPASARSVILKAAVHFSCPVTFVANHNVPFAVESDSFSMVICPKTAGSADDYIVAHSILSDLVITRDIPLAKRLIDKNTTVINDRGLLFDSKNIVRMLKDRELNLQLSAIGVNMGKKTDHYGQKELGAFATCLDQTLTHITNAQ